MSRFRRSFALFAFLAVFSVVAMAAVPPKGCCIAGDYRVHFRDVAKSKCRNPGSGEYTFKLVQAKGCGPKLEGTAVRKSDGVKLAFTGAITGSTVKCCTVEGTFQEPSGAKFKIRVHFCWRKGVFSVKGKATRPDGCVSVWVLTRI